MQSFLTLGKRRKSHSKTFRILKSQSTKLAGVKSTALARTLGNMTLNGSGLIRAASIRRAVLSFPRPLIRCMLWFAMYICRMFRRGTLCQGLDAARAARPCSHHLLLEGVEEDRDEVRPPHPSLPMHSHRRGVPHPREGLPSRCVHRDAYVLGGGAQDDASGGQGVLPTRNFRHQYANTVRRGAVCVPTAAGGTSEAEYGRDAIRLGKLPFI